MSHSRPFHELTPSDFDKYPLWQFAGDEEWEPGKDETWVKPIEGASTMCEAHVAVFTRAEVTASDGTEFLAIADVGTYPVLELIGLYIWTGATLDGLTLASAARFVREADPTVHFAQRIGKATRDVFPLRVRLQALVEGHAHPLEAEIDSDGVVRLRERGCENGGNGVNS